MRIPTPPTLPPAVLGALVGSALLASSAQAAPAADTGSVETTAATQTMTVSKTLYPSDRTVTVGETATYSGTVTKGPRGTKAYFQLYSGGRWVNLTTSTVSSTGRFTLRAKPTATGVRKVRLRIGGDSRYKTYTSYAHTLTISRWRSLSWDDVVDTRIEGRPGGCTGGCTGFKFAAATMVGQSYPSSWITRVDSDGDRSIASFNALRSCTALKATTGLADSSDLGQARFTIEKDGAEPVTLATVPLGSVSTVTTSLDGVYRYQLAAYLTPAASGDHTAVWGSLKMLCH